MSVQTSDSNYKYITTITIEANRVLSDKEKEAIHRQLLRIIVQDIEQRARMRIPAAVRATDYSTAWKISYKKVCKQIDSTGDLAPKYKF